MYSGGSENGALSGHTFVVVTPPSPLLPPHFSYPQEYKNLHKRERTVSRAYGGSRCASCVRSRCVGVVEGEEGRGGLEGERRD